MTILVSVPYFRAGPFIDEAVRNVLAQTYRDLVCLVAGDGEVPPVTIRDDRLVVMAFPTNEGAPHTQQAMLMGSPFGWYAAHGADDWTDPEYLERLMALGTEANASRALWLHHETGVERRENDPAYVEFGVFSADLLRAVGGYGVEKRCGMDTLLYEDILPRVAPIAWCDEPAYHKRMRADSLTHAPDTGFGTPYRNGVVAHNAEVRERCAQIGWADAPAIRAYRASLVPRELRGVLDDRTAAVQAALS